MTLAIPRADVKPQAKALIAKFGNLRGILDAPIEEQRTLDGIGEVAPVALQIAGVEAVVAQSYARIFYRNAVNGGFLLPLESVEPVWQKVRTVSGQIKPIASLGYGGVALD